MTRKKIYIIAGEESGELLGGRLLRSLKENSDTQFELRGVGGRTMATEGVDSLFPMDELSLMGLVEILPHLPKLMRRIRETVEDIKAFQPDILITIDSPGFTVEVVKKLGATIFPKVHYVAPTVWAWKEKRVHKFKKHFDHLLVLLPFEPPYFEKVGLPCHFVGHSILESGADKGNGERFRARYDIDSDDKLLMILPGSRRGEVSRLLPIFEDCVNRLDIDKDRLKIVIPTVPATENIVAERASSWSYDTIILNEVAEKFDSMKAANVALAASGTVALELAMAGTPTVIAYKVSPITYFMLKMLVKVRFAHLLNIIADKSIVPEYLQQDCNPELLAQSITELLGQGGISQIETLQPILRQLMPNSGVLPSEEASNVILKILKKEI